MTISPFDSEMFGDLLSDTEITPFFSDTAAIQDIVAFEIALAEAETSCEVIPKEVGEEIRERAGSIDIDPVELSAKTSLNGVPVAAILAKIRERLSENSRPYLHWGATSQDAVDTGLVLRIKKVLPILENRISLIASHLSALADEHAETITVGRTRFQQATPTTFGYKVAVWREPFLRHLERLKEMKERLLVVSLGGSVGNLSILGQKAGMVENTMAGILDLSVPETAWHTQRDRLAEFAGWLSLISGSAGKIGLDIAMLAQTEVGEISLKSGGGSTTMPQKSNPIAAEVLVTLGRYNAGQLALFHQAQIQENERGGPGFMLEWLVLPQMILATATALKKILWILDRLEIHPERMKSNLEASKGLNLAESAVFQLAAHMTRAEAEEQVKTACERSRQTNEHMIDILKSQASAPIDWDRLKNYQDVTGVAAQKARRRN